MNPIDCLIALGGNVGPVEETFATAIASLRATSGLNVIAVSSFHSTAPMGTDAGNAYLNAAVRLHSKLEPLALLDCLQAIENEHGRKREKHWGPRTLDLDLITFGEEVIENSRLTVPHPHCWYRRFVLDLLVEIAVDVVHPVIRMTFGELRERLLKRPLPLGIIGDDAELASRLTALIPKDVMISHADEPALVFDLDAFAETPRFTLAVPSGDAEMRFEFITNAVTAALG